MLSFVIQHLESHFPAVENVVTLVFPAKVPEWFAWEDGWQIELLCFFVNYVVKMLSLITWAVPKLNEVVVVSLEEFSEFMRNRCRLLLVRVWWWIKNSLGSIDRVCDNDDLIHITNKGGLIDTTSYGKEFGFSRCNIDCMMYGLDDWVIASMDVGY